MDGGVDQGPWLAWRGYLPKLAWWTGGQGGGARARERVQGLRFRGGIGGRDTGPRDGANFATYVVYKKKKDGV